MYEKRLESEFEWRRAKGKFERAPKGFHRHKRDPPPKKTLPEAQRTQKLT